MNSSVIIKHRFHAVGQGLFYSLIFKSPTTFFTMVYDCGSKSNKEYREREISEFRRSLNGRNIIDMLVISHFDDDHVNGIEKLLDKDLKVKSLLMPYLNPYERLFLCLKNINTSYAGYSSMLKDPAKYFRSMNVNNIVYITKGTGKSTSSIDGVDINKHHEFNIEKVYLEIDRMDDDIAIKQNAIDNDNDIDGVLFKNDSIPLLLSGLWQFCFYIAQTKRAGLDQFRKNIDIILNGIKLCDVVWSPKMLSDFRKFYRRVSQDLNISSMACLHGPLQRFPHFCPIFPKFCCDSANRNGKGIGSLGYTLLSGDIMLKDEWATYKDRYVNLINEVSVFQVPHHGSKKNWDNQYCNEFGNADFIISAGKKNSYGHPSKEVVKDIERIASPSQLKTVSEERSWSERRILFV